MDTTNMVLFIFIDNNNTFSYYYYYFSLIYVCRDPTSYLLVLLSTYDDHADGNRMCAVHILTVRVKSHEF